MRKYTLTICFVLCILYCKAQNNYSDIVKPRIQVISKKGQYINTNKFIVLTHDTIYAQLKAKPSLDFIKSSSKRRKLVRKYEAQVFRLTNEKSKTVHHLKQWSVPLIIYVDKEIPKEVKKDLIRFFSQLNMVNNLIISFTPKLKEANYYIKVVEHPVNSYDEDYSFDTETERLNSIYTGATYKLLTDSSYKNYGGVLKLNIENSKNEKLLKQLKQLIFASLGQFYLSSRYEESSLLSKNYNNSNTINENDLELLKMHYAIIYDQKINGTIFNKLQMLQKRQ